MKTTFPTCSVARGGLNQLCLATLLAGCTATAKADLIAFWNFNAGSPSLCVDVRAGHPGTLLDGAVLTPDAQGRTGAAGDRALRLGIGAQRMRVPNVEFLKAATDIDAMSVSLWIRSNTVRNATALSFVQPMAIGQRGFQSHIPWSDSTIYFDTGGCCDGTMRISANLSGTDFSVWHHVALIKNGTQKEIWFDGIQAMTGENIAQIFSGFS